MTIHFFTKGDRNVASSRQRAFLVASELSKRGFLTKVHEPVTELLSQTKWPQKFNLIVKIAFELLQIKKNDIIFLQRAVSDKYFLLLILLYKKIFRRKLIFDFDDAIYLNQFYKTKLLTKLADSVIVGSHALADWAKKYNNHVFFIPTCASFSVSNRLIRSYDNAKKRKIFTIGWAGDGPAHYQNLIILKPVFEGLINRNIDFQFILIGALGDSKVYSLFSQIRNLNVRFFNRYSPEFIYEIIQQFDVGLMPLINNEWNRAKCAFKAVEYMSNGVPAIASSVGENIYLIKDNWNGFLAGSTDEWIDKIIKLYTDTKLAYDIGVRARETVVKQYSFESNIPRLIDILNNEL